jgi:hypothetical protein
VLIAPAERDLQGVTAIKGSLRAPSIDKHLISLLLRASQFRNGFAARSLLQPPDFFDGATPLTYAMLRFLRSCRPQNSFLISPRHDSTLGCKTLVPILPGPDSYGEVTRRDARVSGPFFRVE